VGDSATHLANIFTFKNHHVFPIISWQGEWFAGYPTVEGYPWLHYYLIQPVLSFFQTPGLAMDYYSAIFLLVYYVVCFVLLYYVSRNAILALLFSLIIIYGADSGMFLYVNAFVVFTASQFFLPLIILVTIIAWEKHNKKILLLSSILLALSFYAHASMTGILIIPAIMPFLLLDKRGKVSTKSIQTTLRYFIAFALLSAVQIYQFLVYYFQGQDVSSSIHHPLSDIPARYLYMFSWQNPVLLPLLVIFIPLLFFTAKKGFSHIKPYLISFLFILFIFSLMVFKITGLVIILLAERALWALSLSFLLLCAIIVRQIVGSSHKKSILVGAISLATIAVYLYSTLVLKHPLLVPDIFKNEHQYTYSTTRQKSVQKKPVSNSQKTYKNKYDPIWDYTPLSWNQSFDNYRTDGLSYNIYSNWALWSTNPRYKGRYPAAKGLPLDWSGLVSAAEYGRLGEAGTFDNSQWALNQAIFFFDWYGIKHFEIGTGDGDLAGYLTKEPLITHTETSLNITYHSLDGKYVGPLYAPTEAKTMAVVSPEKQYDNLVRTLSYSTFTSQRLIPIYLGPSLASLNKHNLKYFDAVFLYGYRKSIFAPDMWETLFAYVENGGKLIIETGQKVGETNNVRLPEVFPIKATNMEVISKPWNAEIKNNNLTVGISQSDFTPLKTKYTPYAISEAKSSDLRSWAQAVLAKDGKVVMAYGQLGKGSVVWSGLNLPFHAIDNRNVSETVVFANILSWFFPTADKTIVDFEVSHPNPENISVKSNEGKGVLIKENYSPGWGARLNGEATKIYKAGLFEMYIPFNSRGINEVNLKYYGVPIHWVLFIVSGVSFAGVLTYLFFNKNPLSLIGKFYKRKKKSDEDYY